jgi:hypothetical protein
MKLNNSPEIIHFTLKMKLNNSPEIYHFTLKIKLKTVLKFKTVSSGVSLHSSVEVIHGNTFCHGELIW